MLGFDRFASPNRTAGPASSSSCRRSCCTSCFLIDPWSERCFNKLTKLNEATFESPYSILSCFSLNHSFYIQCVFGNMILYVEHDADKQYTKGLYKKAGQGKK